MAKLMDKDPEKWQRPVRQPDGTVKYLSVTAKERRFIQEYLRTLNPGKSAKYAGYSGSDYDLDLRGRAVVSKPYIREILDRESRKALLSDEEILSRLKAMAGADVSDFFKEVIDSILPDGTVQSHREFDWEVFKKQGYLVKEMVIDGGRVTIKLHDSKHALELLGKHRRLFTETLDVNQTGEVVVKVVKGVSYEDL